MAVRTCSTFEPSSVSTARLISVLFASVATWNTIVRPSRSRWMDVFSVMSGRRMTSVSFISELFALCLTGPAASRPPPSWRSPATRSSRRARPRARWRRNCTPGRLRTAMPSFSSGCTSMSSALPSAPSRFSSSTAAFVLLSLARQLVDHDERAVLNLRARAPRRSRRASPCAAAEVVAARLRPEHRAAVAPQRVADRRRRARGRCPSASTACGRCR